MSADLLIVCVIAVYLLRHLHTPGSDNPASMGIARQETPVLKSILIAIGAAFVAIAGPAIVPILVGILSATVGALVIVGLAVWRTVRKMQRPRGGARDAESTAMGTIPAAAATGRAQWDVRL